MGTSPLAAREAAPEVLAAGLALDAADAAGCAEAAVELAGLAAEEAAGDVAEEVAGGVDVAGAAAPQAAVAIAVTIRHALNPVEKRINFVSLP